MLVEVVMEAVKIEYDRWGRMFYNPEFHSNTGKAWSQDDLQYLIDWYDIVGAEEISFALERTINTVQLRATELRKKGLMPKPAKQIHHERLNKSCLSSRK
jgi:hypothetical protein